MTKLTLPTVLAFERKLEPSDAQMFSGNWEDINKKEGWESIILFDRRNRAVKSNFTKEVLEDEDELQKQLAEPNLSWGDDASLLPHNDTLNVRFTLRILSDIDIPSTCNSAEFSDALDNKLSMDLEEQLAELSNRYAYNIVNGRFLWRNRVGAENVKICVSQKLLSKELEFNAYQYSLKETTSSDADVQELASLIKMGLSGESNIVLTINAYSQLGKGQRVWPSQEMILNGSKGDKSKSRHLFSLNGCAAMHCEKIGNALRTIDDWYPDAMTPIAIEAYGSVPQRGKVYRSTKNDFKTLLLKWLNEDSLSKEEKCFVVAMLIRGGVFGEGES